MITADYINDLCTRSHAMAKEKGWWDEARTPYELGNLCHSELSEALEELRDGRGVTEIYFNDDKPTKPEGFPTELADFVIRLADWAASSGLPPISTTNAVCDSIHTLDNKKDLQEGIYELHNATIGAVKYVQKAHTKDFAVVVAIGMALVFAEAHGIDLPAVIEQKMAYNATRPIRHGRKF